MNLIIFALLKKDYLLAKRSKKFTFFQVIAPAIAILIVSGFGAFMNALESASQIQIPPQSPLPGSSRGRSVNLNLDFNNISYCDSSGESPNQSPCSNLRIKEYDGPPDEEDKESLLNLTYYENKTIHGAVQYSYVNSKHFVYTYFFPDGSEDDKEFQSDVFAAHQHQTDLKYMMNTLNMNISSENYSLRVLPRSFKSLPPVKSSSAFVSFAFLALCLLMPIIGVTRNLVSEKTSVKPYLTAMGLSTGMFYTSHFLFSILKSAGIIFSLHLLAKTKKSNENIIFAGYFLYVLCAISFSLLISSIFKKTKTAIEGLLIIWILSIFAPAFPITDKFYLFVSSLSLNHAFYHFLQVTSTEYIAASAYRPGEYGDLDWKVFLIAMGLDVVWMLSFTFIIDWTRQRISESGWKGIFTSKCCEQKDKFDPEEQEVLTPDQTVILPDGIEIDEARDNATADIDLKNLTKVYSTGEKAVNGLTLRAIRGQVSVLLGHNGCGKSSTFSMIAGIVTPTSGSITIEEINAVRDRESARDLIGLCPQYNPLYDNLTVMEHLELVHKLKNGDQDEFDDEAGQFLKAIDLAAKANTLSKNLSGGMKRKLCVCMALIGGSRVILLDEPTAGMDPGARQDVQRLLELIKAERTILLTTHYMDEAERLGDWIFVMSRGKMATCGSAGFLKKKFGAGYLLTVVVENTTNDDELELDYEMIQNLCKSFVPEAEMKDCRGQMIEISLPEHEKPQILMLLKALEAVIQRDLESPNLKDLAVPFKQSLVSLSITTIGMSLKSLEQVFIKIGEECDAVFEEKGDSEKTERTDKYTEFIDEKEEPLLTGLELYTSQCIALFQKRIFYSLRNKSHYITQLFCPILILLIFCVLATRKDDSEILKTFDLTAYPESTAFIVSAGENTINIEIYLKKFDKITVKKLGRNASFEEIFSSLEKDDKKMAFILAYYGPQSFEIHFNSEIENSKSIMTNFLGNLLILDDPRGNGKAKIETKAKWIKTKDAMEKDKDPGSDRYAGVAFMICFGLALCVAPFVAFLVEERSCRFLHQQFLAGLSPVLFWVTNFVYDGFVYSILYFFYALIPVAFGFFWNYFLIYALLLILYFITILPIMYITSAVMSSPTKSTILFFCYLLLMPILVDTVLKQVNHDSEVERDVYKIIGYLLVPSLAFLNSFKKLVLVSSTFLTKKEFIARHGFYDLMVWNGIGRELISISGIIVLSIAVMIAQNSRCIRRWVFYKTHRELKRSKKRDLILKDTNCESVQIERDLIKNDETEGCIVVIDDLIKKYDNFRALNGISLTVRKNECFGLLGTNGAGKTTAFDILTSRTFPNGGSATIDGNDVTEMAFIGYCPQFDAILPELTGIQALKIMARLNGYKNPGKVAWIVLNCIGMAKHGYKIMKKLSGGQKRKLSVGIALLSRSKCVMLDEPTAGIDPRARRDIWDVMIWLRQKCGTSLVLTSHSMEECEALCTRIAVMKTGEVVALGTSQELKSQYGNTYTMTLILHKSEDRQNVCEAVALKLPYAVLKTPPTNITLSIVWQLPKLKFDKWSEKFEMVQNLTLELKVKDYMLIQSSLEDAFISITGSNIL